MTDVVKLCNTGNIVINGAAVTSCMVTGRHASLSPIIINTTPVSGVNGVTNNGYLDNRFRP